MSNIAYCITDPQYESTIYQFFFQNWSLVSYFLKYHGTTSSPHLRQMEESGNDHENGNLLRSLQPVFCILIGFNCIFQGQCTLISMSTDEPVEQKANVHITKVKLLRQA